MPRLPRLCPPGLPLHVMQRGHNRQACFTSVNDFATYAHGLIECSRRYLVLVHAWVFMSNHVHLLLTPLSGGSVSRMMQTLNRNYVCYFNSTYQRSGTLWEGRFKSCMVESTNYLLCCYRYIELNPVRAGIVKHPADYTWSSYRSNALGLDSKLLTPHEEYLRLGPDPDSRLGAYRALFQNSIDPDLVQDLRESTHGNLAFGSEHFKEEAEAAFGRRLRPQPPGRRWKSVSES